MIMASFEIHDFCSWPLESIIIGRIIINYERSLEQILLYNNASCITQEFSDNRYSQFASKERRLIIVEKRLSTFHCQVLHPKQTWWHCSFCVHAMGKCRNHLMRNHSFPMTNKWMRKETYGLHCRAMSTATATEIHIIPNQMDVKTWFPQSWYDSQSRSQ